MKHLSAFLDYYTTLTVLYKQLGVKVSQCGTATKYKVKFLLILSKLFKNYEFGQWIKMYLRIDRERTAYPYSSSLQLLDLALPKGFHSCQQCFENIVNKKV